MPESEIHDLRLLGINEIYFPVVFEDSGSLTGISQRNKLIYWLDIKVSISQVRGKEGGNVWIS